MPKVTTGSQELRNTPEGSRLYNWWVKARQARCVSAFEKFPDFYKWAMQTYELGAKLERYNPDKPYSPENCYFVPPKRVVHVFTEKQKEWIHDWNSAANRIRKHYNMSPLPGTTYEDA